MAEEMDKKAAKKAEKARKKAEKKAAGIAGKSRGVGISCGKGGNIFGL